MHKRHTIEKLLISVAPLALAALLVPQGPLFAAPSAFVANLAGANENPATPSSGTGTAIVIVDPTANTMHVTVTFSGLTSGTTASHIHCCEATPGANANVMVATTTPTFAGFPLGVTSGSYNNTLDLTQASSYNPAFITSAFDPSHTVAGAEAALITGIQNSETYLNIHTTQFPGGEIRGLLVAPQLTPLVPTDAGKNALAVAGAIDAVFASGNAPAEFVGLLNQPPDLLPDTLERIAGQNASAAAQAGHESMRQFLALVLNPFAGTRPAQPVTGAGTLWGAGYASHMRVEGFAARGLHTDINGGGGFAVGYDFSLAPASVIGAAFLYDYRDFDVAQGFGKGHNNGYDFSIYGNTNSGDIYVTAAAAYSLLDVHSERDISITGTSANYDESYMAHAFGGRVEAGFHFPFGGPDVTPFIAVLADSVSIPAQTETTVSGTSKFAIQSPSHSFTRIRSELGVGINNIALDSFGLPLLLNGRVGWAHEFEGSDSIPMAFAAFPAQTFTITGPRLGDAAFMSAGVITPVGPGLTLGANIEADAGNAFNYGGNLQLRFLF